MLLDRTQADIDNVPGCIQGQSCQWGGVGGGGEADIDSKTRDETQ
jgi:hypothetical protein